MEDLGKIIIYIALLLLVIGGFVTLMGRLGIPRLPGDIYVKKNNFTFYFPITTCIIVSVVLSLILRLFRR